MTTVRNEDNKILKFDKNKITESIWEAVESVGGENKDLTEKLTDQVVDLLEQNLKPNQIPTTEDVLNATEKILIENGHARTAKAFILLHQKRVEFRRAKNILGVEDDLGLSLNALTVMKNRYLKKDENGKVIETPRQTLERVAKTIAQGDKKYGKPNEEIKKTEKEFLEMMINLEFLPNSPTLMNAGTQMGQLSACFVLPLQDSVESIFETLKDTALVQKSGGGTGFSFSNLRPRGDVVQTTGGIAAGPLFFVNAFDSALRGIKQGMKRYSTNMGILRVDHPDIFDFIMAKEKEGVLSTFNLSVGITDKFMRAVENNGEYDLINPRDNKISKRLKARAIWNLIITMAWKNGEPGVIFIDKLNKYNPTPNVGIIEATNPCGEQPLLPYESCNLGSINLSKMLKGKNGDMKIDWDKLRETIRKGVHFLDNVVDLNKYPIEATEKVTKSNRKIGLGIMGFADMIIQLGIPYNSEEGVKAAEKVMKFITDEGRNMSEELGKQRGSFENFKGSVWEKKGYKHIRNATVTTIAPTSNISIVAGCSSSIEPLFAISYIRNVASSLGQNLIEINPLFEKTAIQKGFYSDELMKDVLSHGSIQIIKEIPDDVKKVFVTAHDIPPEWHVKMQAAFQKYTDNAVSKTVNFPHQTTPDDIESVYKLAYDLGCKGITVYRDGSRQFQIIKNSNKEKETHDAEKKPLVVESGYAGGCDTCGI
ncbi:MAG: ribonucleoside-diphosphate reductase, adenosylcobalamin-dependent [Candidatus Aenigmarchaeota archaeon CG_4_10_14_0_8_um_filter_37_24]|nr:MAG: ribonucleoside-diphosphate reductase, adenosylcobalamin-dependent [Candidatus Aenigmarchaeota archaeon CG1_02_38_14]PIV69578.1 MAG: ribonucleoside-diphosphate reductase, adenosylcobalamin-dependent [Candidatus Aenigmarchaeota archaeon CG01_land_8_20_14_3_00_37_9]PIW41416.1 MAG: ribonucleoside-diphosphate reductase, adenosylcobalamin-dependent [Candidatus Aenigmarchaeota archaeon CG15_BIG_FIL_POST_REV_8_21_14_020_37_27]PIX50458.1 MAG: ribonucleoside-diphosphate reductase, adenosylcobalami